ncbi:MAG: hypothetical protein JOZ77_09890 [Candidatus Eremiobacteraeota bacterium]|nr:hypothetical protein [Candidatus Eremiobacteraeota bacterium]
MRINGAIVFTVALALVGAPALFAVPSAGWAKSHPTPSPSPTPVADPAVTKIARQQFVQWQAGAVNKSVYAEQLLPQLTDAKIADTSHALAQLGALIDTVFIGDWLNPDFPAGTRGYIYQMRCTIANVYEWIAFGPDGKLVRFFFRDRLDVETVTPAPSATPSGL